MSEEKKNSPTNKIRVGAIVATTWENTRKGSDGKDFTVTSVSLVRNYKDKDDNWQETNSFRVQDLPKAVLALNKSFEEIVVTSEENGND